MSSFKPRVIIALMLACACAPLAAAQEQHQQPAPQYVESTGFKNRIFEVKHRDPEDLLSVIKLLTSGFKGAQASADRNFKTITVRDFPENIAAIEDALKRLDTPEAPRPEIELHMHVLIAANEGGGTTAPAELRDVLSQLQSTLNFKNYYLLTSVIQRAKERTGSNPGFLQGEGVVQITLPDSPNPHEFTYSYNASNLAFGANAAGATTIQLNGLDFRLNGNSANGSARIRSDVGLREGEKVVVGTAGLKDKALIIVLTAKLLK
ncbi:MAG TPA: secretin N-terminal domain-containing protein [Pyrinomonadaceae bacterium]|jgi:hypothetical protein